MIKASDLIDKFNDAWVNRWGYIWGQSGAVWTQAKQNNATREMTVKYGSRWIGHNVADCSGLFVWAYKQYGEKIYHGSNTIYKSYCKAKGKLAGNELRPGTAVFTGTENDHGHIGLYIGGGKVIEAKGTQYGVVQSDVTEKRWTYWGELKDVLYDGEEPEPIGRPTLRRGDRGDYVKEAQKLLIQHGFDCGSTGADGIFGAKTEAAVKAFQTSVDLTSDGVIGKLTWAALLDETITLYTVVIPHLAKHHADALVANYNDSYMIKEERSDEV